MLKVDLGLLKRMKRLEIDELVPVDSPVWRDIESALDSPLQVHLVVEESGEDVVASGRLSGNGNMPCRRCVDPVAVELDHSVSLLFRAGITELEAEAAEDHVYALPPRSRELDLSNAIREHVILGMPEYVLCNEKCRGLCPHCGTDLNRDTCDCTAEPVDDRWAALRRVKPD
ncbi:MAG: DUF177 domain-containing protein [Longimicrobiales bacterium]